MTDPSIDVLMIQLIDCEIYDVIISPGLKNEVQSLRRRLSSNVVKK